MQRIYRFRLELSPEQCLGYYQGIIQYVLVQAESGERVQLRAENFRAFITHNGLSGSFELTTTEQGKFIALKKIN
ncbi:DUF2835 family protein [Rheinheimera riviphila]|uniref:DUF2835 family protein n=1 Tax=Rheinheimera riviphila TaxID=1834037 RepID=A0A437R2D8_9GAMM|nr:DUF2835 family protein [Rheinheimera riviphila]RVU40837.1 DUF2835 family protein [Rheinheimera riviphila]